MLRLRLTTCVDMDMFASKWTLRLRTDCDGVITVSPISRVTGGRLRSVCVEAAIINSVFLSFSLSMFWVIHILRSRMQEDNLVSADFIDSGSLGLKVQ